jgi:hypothetical protein
MTDPGFKLSYTWDDLRPVHPLFVTVLIGEALGALSGLWLKGIGDWYEAIWAGAALATLPGFLVGLFIQHRLRPGSIGANRSLVIYLGAVILLLFVCGLTFPWVAG